MLKTIQERLDNRKGFTLIELIVVIAIIAILAAVLLPQMTGFTQKARNSNTLSEAKNIATAFSVMAAEKPNGVVCNDETKISGTGPDGDKVTPDKDSLHEKLVELAGDFEGTITTTTEISVKAGVNFTYTKDGYEVTVIDGRVETAPDEG